MAKHRNGAVEDVKLRFRKEQARFTDWDDISLDGMTSYESSMGISPNTDFDMGDAPKYGNDPAPF